MAVTLECPEGHNDSVKSVRVAVMTLIVFGASCTEKQAEKAPSSPTTPTVTSPSPPRERQVADYSSFTQALEAAGFDVRTEGRVRFFEDIVGVPTRVVSFDGADVWTMQYPTSAAFRSIRSSVSPRGDEVGSAIINWGDPPRYYGSGRLLVMYFGDRQRALESLDLLLGPPFAGS
jgi:hypothetical protein